MRPIYTVENVEKVVSADAKVSHGPAYLPGAPHSPTGQAVRQVQFFGSHRKELVVIAWFWL